MVMVSLPRQRVEVLRKVVNQGSEGELDVAWVVESVKFGVFSKVKVRLNLVSAGEIGEYDGLLIFESVVEDAVNKRFRIGKKVYETVEVLGENDFFRYQVLSVREVRE